jgi:hypothetical protein
VDGERAGMKEEAAVKKGGSGSQKKVKKVRGISQ